METEVIISKEWVKRLKTIPRVDAKRLMEITNDEGKLIYVGNLENALVSGKNLFVLHKNEIQYSTYDTNYEINFTLQNICKAGDLWDMTVKEGNTIPFISLADFIDKYDEYNLKHILTENTLEVSNIDIGPIKPAIPIATTEKREDMRNNNVTKIMDANTEAAKVAAQITAGRALNKAVLEKVKPNLPFMVKGYADSSIGPVVIANLVSYAVTTFANDNEKAQWAANAMMVAAMADFMDTFNVEKMLAEVLSAVDVTVPVE